MKNKKVYMVIGLLILSIIIVIVCIFTFTKNHYSTAKSLIEDDLGKTISCQKIYYCDKCNGYVVCFTSEGKNDIATIDVKNNKIGYSSVFDSLTSPKDIASSSYQVLWTYCTVDLSNGFELVYTEKK